jgi:hypothetical protein
MSGFFPLDDGEESVGEPIDGGGVDSLGIRDGIADKGKMGPVDESHAVEEEKSRVCHRKDHFAALVKGHGEKKNWSL